MLGTMAAVSCCRQRAPELKVRLGSPDTRERPIEKFARGGCRTSWQSGPEPKDSHETIPNSPPELLAPMEHEEVLAMLSRQTQEVREVLLQCTRDMQRSHEESLSRSEAAVARLLNAATAGNAGYADAQVAAEASTMMDIRLGAMGSAMAADDFGNPPSSWRAGDGNGRSARLAQEEVWQAASKLSGRLNDARPQAVQTQPAVLSATEVHRALRVAREPPADGGGGLRLDRIDDSCSPTSPTSKGSALFNTGESAALSSPKTPGGTKIAHRNQVLELDDEEGEEGEEAQQTLVGRVMHSSRFKTSVSLVIMVNSLFIGAQTQRLLDIQKANPGASLFELEWYGIEVAFLAFFTVECAMRIYCERLKFFTGSEKHYNIFDFALVLLGFSDAMAGVLPAPNLSFARIFRIVRFMRILRVVRVMRLFNSFRIMVYAIVHSATSLMWIFLILLFVMYAFSVLFLFGVAEFLQNDIGKDAVQVGVFLGAIQGRYDSVATCLLTLFKCITGGIDWEEAMEPMQKISTLYGCLFAFFIYFTTFGVLNVVTSMFVDSVHKVSRGDREVAIQEEMRREVAFAKGIRSFFYEADTNQSGGLSWNQFANFISDERSRAWCSSMELDVTQARALFLLLDVDNDGLVRMEEFVEGAMRLKGVAKSIDVNMILYENEKMIQRWGKFMERHEEQFLKVAERLSIDTAVMECYSPSFKKPTIWNSGCPPPEHRNRLTNAVESLAEYEDR